MISGSITVTGAVDGAPGQDGNNSVRIDLDNQADIIACTASGKVRYSRTITVHARIFDGASQATSGVGAPAAAVLVLAGVTPTVRMSNGIVTISWTFANTVILSSPSYAVTIPLTYGGKTYSQAFNLTTANASYVYQVAPYPSEIVFTRSGTDLVPASINATCDYTLDEGMGPVKDTVNKSNIGPQHLAIYYRYIYASGGLGTWMPYTAAVSIPNTTPYKAVDFGIGASGSDASMVDIERVPIVRDGASGTITQKIYKSTNSSVAPERPTGDSPSGWSTDRTAITTGNRYRYVSSRSSDDGGATWTAWSNPVLDAYLAEDGTSIKINGAAVAIAQGSQTLDDVDQAYSGGIPDGGIVLMNSTADPDEDSYVRDRANDDWVEVPASEGDGYLLDGHLWMRTSVSGASNPTKRWQDCGQIQGPKGDDAVLYTLECNPSKINFRSNAAGEFSGSFTVAAVIKKITGNATPVIINEGSTTGVYLYCRREGLDSRWYYYSSTTNRTVTASQAIAVNMPVTAISVCLSTESNYHDVTDSNILATANIPVICDGRRGVVGATGKMFYPMGIWNANVEYTKEDESIPLVWVDDLNTIDPATGEYGAYWYLTADSDIGHKPQDGSAYWAKASHFGLVITRGIFAEFARLGKFIMTGDWMLSTNGTIDGVAYNNGQLYNDKPAYMWFNPEYPNTDHITDDKHNFLPNYAVDGLTGRSYQNSAFIRGEIHATSGEFTGRINSTEGAIGGFTISQRALTNDAAVPGNKVQIGGDNFKAAIGGCDVPLSDDVLYGARISSDFSANSVDGVNVAVRARAKYGAQNFALHGLGHVVTNGMAVGYQLQIMGFTNSEYARYINIKLGNIVLLKETEPGHEKYAILPTLLNVRDSLSIPSNEPFAVKLTLLIQSASDTQMHLRGYDYRETYTGDDYPPHQRDNYFTDHLNHDVELGQVYTYMLVWDGISGHTHYNAWLVGYGDRGY